MSEKMSKKAIIVGNQYAKEKEYWLDKLSGELIKTSFPFDYKKNDKNEFNVERIEFELSDQIYKKLMKISTGSDPKLFMLLIAGVVTLLQKFTGNDDIIIGAPIFKQDVEADFVNTVLVLRNKIEKEHTFKDMILQVRKAIKEATENQNYPLEALLYQLNMTFSKNDFPLFDVVVLLENIQNKNYIEHINSNITFAFTRTEERIKGVLEYNKSFYERTTIERIIKYFRNILEAAVSDVNILLKEISILFEEERNQLLFDFNNTDANYSKGKMIHELFEEQVELTSDKIAVIFEDKCLTYKQLNEKANQLARFIRAKNSELGIANNRVVAIRVERSIEMIVGMLAILKSGGAYLPIDCEYPEERMAFLIKDSETSILLTQNQFMDKVESDGIVIDLNQESLYSGDSSNLNKINESNDLAYIIYTSGSTGEPKGVAVEHNSIINTLCWRRSYYGFSSDDCILQIPSYCFDSSVEDIFTPLISGAKIALIQQENKLNLQYLKKVIEENQVSHFLITPALYKTFLEEIYDSLKNVKTVTLAGDSFTEEFVKEHFTKLSHVRLFNEYGPTENSVCTTVYEFSKEKTEVKIGKPIGNVKCYIIDRDGNLCTIGIPGELCVTGKGLARGYLNRPELTEEKFVFNSFITPSFSEASLRRMYKTGDLARWLPDGNIEFLGRMDHQVKIRGFRIELGEIENQILKYEQVKEVVVVAKEETDGSKRLCAYYVADEKVSNLELMVSLSNELPDYMIPSYFVQLEQMPLNSNGKIDRKALPEPKLMDEDVEYVPPKNEIEEKLVEVCQEVLGVERIGTHDNFFKLGGDSIKTIQISSRLLKFGYKIETKDMFEYPTIAELSEHVKIDFRKADQGIVKGEVKLTPIQKCFFEKNFADMHHWNQPVMLFKGCGFDEEIIHKVFTKILEHHDALRLCYKKVEDTFLQCNRDIDGEFFTLEIVDIKNEQSDYATRIEAEANKLQASFDLNNGPLVQVGLFRTIDGDYLFIAIHHLVVDGLSWRIILEDFATGYMQVSAGEDIIFQDKTDSFKLWADEITDYANSKEHLKELDYWMRLDNTEVAYLPKDHIISENRNEDENKLKMSLSENETVNLLKHVNQAYNTEINDILLTALGMAIKDWTGEDNILINLEGHGRENIIHGIDVTRTVGWFTSDYPVILKIDNLEDLSYQIKSVKEELRKIPNKGIGYGIFKYLTLQENKKPLEFKLKPEIGFNYLGQFDQDVDQEFMNVSTLSTGYSMSPKAERLHRIELNSMIIDEKFTLEVSYNKHEYNTSTIKDFIENYKAYLGLIIEFCMNKTDTEFTPSDLTDEELSIEELDNILEFVDSI